ERNGTLTITSIGHKSTGKWRIQKDQLCLDTGNEPGGGCYEVWLSGRNVELRNQTSSVPLRLCFRNLTRADNPPRIVDECKAKFNEERAAHRRACTSCRDGVGLNSSHGREIPKTYGRANPRQTRRHGTDG